VKAVLDVIGLDDCIRKGSAFKRLRMSFNVADGIHPAVMPYFNERGAVSPFLVIAFENKVAMSTLKDRLSSAPLVPVPKGKENDDGRGNNPQPPIDAVCLLGRGIVWNIRPAIPRS